MTRADVPDCDIAVLGAGIVGAATARRLQQRHPGKRVLLLDKETEGGRHQTGHNSGVIHAGVYYPPGSLKARFCRQGLAGTLRFCREQGLPREQCGKLLVATDEPERGRMQDLYARCLENGIEAEQLDARQLKHREPHITGLGAIFVPATAITDFGAVCRRLTELFRGAGGMLRLPVRVRGIEENDRRVRLHTTAGGIDCGCLVVCAGLHSDRMARRHGLRVDFRIIPFRGEYYRLPSSRNGLIRHLIYPIPDPVLPFLGVHLTRMIDGGITAGPNAVLGWKREGYGRCNFNLRDAAATLSYPGFWRLARRQYRHALEELRNSWCRSRYLRALRRYCPELEPADLLPWPAGVRAQAVLRDGSLAHDFLFLESPRSLHVCNAPSPAATSALPIAEYLCDRLAAKINR